MSPYRTAPIQVRSWSFRAWLNSIRDWFKYLFTPMCKRPGGVCEFHAVREVRPGWHLDKREDVLHYDEPIVGSPNKGGFYWGMLIPYEIACKHCERPFRLGDPIPKGARLRTPWGRTRPEHLSEEEWAALKASGYFNRTI